MASRNKDQLEVFAQHLSLGATAPEAAEAAGYPKRSLKTFSANARKRSQRPDVRRRVMELRSGNYASLLCKKEWMLQRLYQIANPDLGRKLLRPSDQIAAIRVAAQITGDLSPEKHAHDIAGDLVIKWDDAKSQSLIAPDLNSAPIMTELSGLQRS
jgi:hypothetical protein